MSGLRTTTCACGKQVYEAMERCSSCAQIRQKRMSQHNYTLPTRPAKQLTPPPSQPTTPRRSLESSVTVAPYSAPRLSYANEALTSAFNSESGIPTTLFPPSLYRPMDQSSSRTSSVPSSRSPSETPSAMVTPAILSPASEQPGRKPSRSATPHPIYAAQAGYAPMAAGFARLSRKDASEQARRGRAEQTRPSLELEARMFSGPA